jgi:hydrogenase nickel incorporation protein HypA/HybF
MHEYSIVRALLDRVEAEARSRNAIAVHRLRVRIGELSGVESDLMASAYSLAREGTICESAEMDITRVPVEWGCPSCGQRIPAGAILRCPGCEVPARLITGDEILLEQIEMEVA